MSLSLEADHWNPLQILAGSQRERRIRIRYTQSGTPLSQTIRLQRNAEEFKTEDVEGAVQDERRRRTESCVTVHLGALCPIIMIMANSLLLRCGAPGKTRRAKYRIVPLQMVLCRGLLQERA